MLFILVFCVDPIPDIVLLFNNGLGQSDRQTDRQTCPWIEIGLEFKWVDLGAVKEMGRLKEKRGREGAVELMMHILISSSFSIAVQ